MQLFKQLPWVLSNDRSCVFEFSIREQQKWSSVKKSSHNRSGGVATDRGLAGFVPWKHLWSQMNAPMVSPARASLTGGDVIWGACQSWPESFSHQKRTGEKREAVEERKSFHSSCPFKGRENLPWLTRTHLASLANRKCPLQLFFQWRRGPAPLPW